MSDRDTLRAAFLDRSGWGQAEIGSLAGDASNRRYFRLRGGDGTVAVLMDAPPEKGEDTRPFIRIARHLSGLGLGAPEIMAEDTEHGFLLLEDLGDALFARVLEQSPELEQPLYTAACDVLLHLHQSPAPHDLPEYNPATMSDLAALAFDWYLPGATGAENADAREQFRAVMKTVLQEIERVTEVLIQRDYHAENLLWMPEREGLLRVGLLDFQDAAAGHRAYDLVSLLQDARRDVSPEVEAQTLSHYIAESGADDAAFRRAYHLLGIQRNLRIVGVFARLCIRDGKAHYVDLIPRVWAHLQRSLAIVASADLNAALAPLHAPTPDLLKAIKDKCKSQTQP